jgi:hypothetical protein
MTFPIDFAKDDPGKCEASWWLEAETRAEFHAAAERESKRMKLSRIAHTLNSVTEGQIKSRGSR